MNNLIDIDWLVVLMFGIK